jgi:hypothetical protein
MGRGLVIDQDITPEERVLVMVAVRVVPPAVVGVSWTATETYRSAGIEPGNATSTSAGCGYSTTGDRDVGARKQADGAHLHSTSNQQPSTTKYPFAEEEKEVSGRQRGRAQSKEV